MVKTTEFPSRFVYYMYIGNDCLTVCAAGPKNMNANTFFFPVHFL